MTWLSQLLFIHLILTGAYSVAATSNLEPDLTQIQEESPAPAPSRYDPMVLVTTDIAPAQAPLPKLAPATEEHLHEHRSLTPRLGRVFELGHGGGHHGPSMTWGMTYLLPSPHALHWQFGLDVTNLGVPLFSCARRFVYHTHTPLTPFGLVGINTRFVAKERLPSLIHFQNLQALAAVGLEQQVRHNLALEVEAEIAYGSHHREVVTYGGLAIGF